jgi:hypothetical protein
LFEPRILASNFDGARSAVAADWDREGAPDAVSIRSNGETVPETVHRSRRKLGGTETPCQALLAA